MTGAITLNDPEQDDGELALIEEENGEWSLYAIDDVEEQADGSWGPVGGAEPSGTLNLGTANTGDLSVTEGGSVQLDMVGTRHSVPSGESVTIPEGYSEVVVGPYGLDGELTVNGRMEIL
jgi:hypothetical protein